MGTSHSKQSCIKHRRSSQVIPGKPKDKRSRRRSSSFRDIVKDINTFLTTSDSSTIRKQVGNYFTITSTRNRLEFAHGEKDNRQKLKWVTTKDFQFSRLLGAGGFGAVYKARRLSTGKDYALKIQPMEVMARSAKSVGKKVEDETLLHMERTVLASCRGHPFIVELEYAFHTDSYAVLGLEYIPGGTLSFLISNSSRRRLSFEICKLYTIELALALHFMHCKGIIYRDLKPSNILVSLDGHLKLTDFGLAGSIVKYKNTNHNIASDVSQLQLDPDLLVAMSTAKHDERTGSTDDIISDASTQDGQEILDPEQNGKRDLKWVRRRTVCGTAGYRPPEQVQERFLDYFSRCGYDERADWFSLGVCCFTMLTGRRPFPTKKELLQSDSQRNLVLAAETVQSKANINVEAAERAMNDAEYRCLMFEVNFPSHFTEEPQAQHFIEALLARNPEERPRYDGIVGHPWMKGESFDANEVVKRPTPRWIKDHAYLQSIRSNESHSSNNFQGSSLRKSQRSLTECIESLCSDCFDKYGAAYAENFAIKWSTLARTETLNLFRHWNYMSDDVVALEAQAAFRNENNKSNKPSSSRKLGEVLHCHSPSNYGSSYKRSKRKT